MSDLGFIRNKYELGFFAGEEFARIHLMKLLMHYNIKVEVNYISNHRSPRDTS